MVELDERRPSARTRSVIVARSSPPDLQALGDRVERRCGRDRGCAAGPGRRTARCRRRRRRAPGPRRQARRSRRRRAGCARPPRGTRPSTARASVVLPEPVSPISPTISPRSTVRRPRRGWSCGAGAQRDVDVLHVEERGRRHAASCRRLGSWRAVDAERQVALDEPAGVRVLAARPEHRVGARARPPDRPAGRRRRRTAGRRRRGRGRRRASVRPVARAARRAGRAPRPGPSRRGPWSPRRRSGARARRRARSRCRTRWSIPPDSSCGYWP